MSSVFSRTTTKSMSSGSLPASGVSTPGSNLTGPEVDVLVEAEAKFQQQPLFEDTRGDAGMAHRAEQDRVEGGQLFDRSRGKDFAGPQVAVAAVVEVLELQVDLLQGGDRLEDFDRFLGDFGPRAVAADHCYLKPVVAFRHAGFLNCCFLNCC